MAEFSYRSGQLYAEDLPVAGLASEFGTPLYIYSAAHVRKQYHAFRTALAGVLDHEPLIAFACKANDRIAVMKLIGAMGGGVDIVSGGEMRKALAAGIAPEKIIFSGVGKTGEELVLALKNGIRQINIESEPELDTLLKLSESVHRPIKILFRLNPDVEAGTHDKISTGRSEDKFGLSAEAIMRLYPKAAASRYLTASGISLHIGSQVSDARYFIPGFERMAALVKELRVAGQTVTDLDLGGGLGITYRDEPEADLAGYAKIIKDIIVPLGCHLGFEPGRFLVGNAGILLSRVIYVKETQVKNHLILDAAMNDLIRPALYDAWHTVIPVHEPGHDLHVYDLVGPVCESGDTFAKDRPLPLLSQGDLLAFKSVGAYGASMSSTYNARPPAAEVLVDGQTAQLIYKAPSIEEWIARELAMLQ